MSTTINGEKLDVIMAHYYVLPLLIAEAQAVGVDFTNWDEARSKVPKNIRIIIVEEEGK